MKYIVLICMILLANVSYCVEELKATGQIRATIVQEDAPYTPQTLVYTAQGPTLQVIF